MRMGRNKLLIDSTVKVLMLWRVGSSLLNEVCSSRFWVFDIALASGSEPRSLRYERCRAPNLIYVSPKLCRDRKEASLGDLLV